MSKNPRRSILTSEGDDKSFIGDSEKSFTGNLIQQLIEQDINILMWLSLSLLIFEESKTRLDDSRDMRRKRVKNDENKELVSFKCKIQMKLI